MDSQTWLNYLASAPLVLTKVARLASDCDHIEGFFARDPVFQFEAFLADTPSEDTYPGTRIAEIYIRCEGESFSQWQWHSSDRNELTWEHGKKLMAEFCAGFEAATKAQTASAHDYCTLRLTGLIEQFVDSGIGRDVIAGAVADIDRRARNWTTGGLPPAGAI